MRVLDLRVTVTIGRDVDTVYAKFLNNPNLQVPENLKP